MDHENRSGEKAGVMDKKILAGDIWWNKVERESGGGEEPIGKWWINKKQKSAKNQGLRRPIALTYV